MPKAKTPNTPAEKAQATARRLSPADMAEVVYYLEPRVPALLPDAPGMPSNLLPFAATSLPLDVEIEMWGISEPSEDDPEYLRFYWNNECILESVFTEPVQPHERLIRVPVQHMTHGTHELHYEVQIFNGSVTPSLALTITIDNQPPRLPEANEIIFPDEVMLGGVTDRYLHENDDQLLGEVPAYQDRQVGDTLYWYWSDTPNGREQVDARELLDLDNPLVLAIPGDFIRQFSNGVCYARYEVQDRAGTAIQYSLAQSLQTTATPTERILLPPRILEADGATHTSTLLPRNTLDYVTFTLPSSVIVGDDEEMTVYWGEPGTPGAYQTSTPAEPDVQAYHIPWQYVAHGMGKTIPLDYTLKDYKGENHISQTHRLRITTLTGLPIIQCLEIRGNLLVLDTLGDSATFTLQSWRFMAASQYVTVWLEGVKLGDIRERVTLPIVTEMPVPDERPVIDVGSVSKTALQGLERGYQFVVKVQVSFDDKQSWIPFPLISATLVDQLP